MRVLLYSGETMNADSRSLYANHLTELRSRYDRILADTGFDAVVIVAGTPVAMFRDDQHLPFKTNPMLLQWAPLTEHPGTLLVYAPGSAPRLLVYAPPDYWHTAAPVPELVSGSHFDVRIVSEAKHMRSELATLPPRTALIGTPGGGEPVFEPYATNPTGLMHYLDLQRSLKTAWEIDNIRQANGIALAGHAAAERAFAAGGAEYDIHAAFRSACRVTDAELPYAAIVAMDEHAATLHYQRLERTRPRPGEHSLLIDAGIAVHGYASDITRTHTTDAGFQALIDAVDTIQQNLCAGAVPGVDFRTLHREAHRQIAELLHTADIVRVGPDECLARGISRAFFPHGLGHFLGLQVHDAGGRLGEKPGETCAAPDGDPYLRLTRVLKPGNVITIEPGLYFIDSLLDKLQQGPHRSLLNWPRIRALQRFGGIRIEDNVLIRDTDHENLTRMAEI